MSYQRKRQLLFALLAVLIVLAWSPLRVNVSSDAAVFFVVLGMIIGGYWLIERLIGKGPR